MKWLTLALLLPADTTHRRVFLYLLAVLVALAVPMRDISTANAAPAQVAAAHAASMPAANVAAALTIDGCAFAPPINCYPAPLLLNLDQAGFGATATQKESLRKLEDKAIDLVIEGHSLSAADKKAVQTWGRDDALAHLYWLLLEAVESDARTADEQNAVDWLSAIVQRPSVDAAHNAGREYVKWAGLNQGEFESLLNRSHTKGDVQAFLSGTPLNYNNTNTSQATGGWCVYRSPSPYESDYQGYLSQICHGPCPFGCLPPHPTYDQLVKWVKRRLRSSG